MDLSVLRFFWILSEPDLIWFGESDSAFQFLEKGIILIRSFIQNQESELLTI